MRCHLCNNFCLFHYESGVGLFVSGFLFWPLLIIIGVWLYNVIY